MNLLDLAKRCEAAGRADRELSAQIQVLVFENPNYQFPAEVLNRKPFDWREAADRFRHDGMGGSEPYPDYTGSISAAMKLLPENWFIYGMGENVAPIRYCGDCHDHIDFWAEAQRRRGGLLQKARAGTLALAVCAAALRARAAAEEHN